MIPVATILFAIQAGVRLGSKVHQVLLDATQERVLVMPMADDLQGVQETEARMYFIEHPELTAPGGPYEGLQKEDRLKAYRTILKIGGQFGGGAEGEAAARDSLTRLGAMEQVKQGFASRPPIQRLLGTVAEIAIDWFTANPGALEQDSDAKKVLAAFLRHLDDVQIAESAPRQLVEQVFHASLRVLQENSALIDDDARAGMLVGGVTQALLADYDELKTVADQQRHLELVRRIGTSVLRGGAQAFGAHLPLFMRNDNGARKLVESTLRGVLRGIDGKEDLFNNESLALIYHSALGAVVENRAVLVPDAFLQQLIGGIATVLSEKNVREVFGPETAAAIVQVALEAVQEHVETLVHADSPQRQLLADTVRAVALGLGKPLAGANPARELLSRKQLVELVRIVFVEVAKSPENLLAGVEDEARRTALAQIVGSVAAALGEEPAKLVTGEGFLQIVRVALSTGVLNADKLLKLDSTPVSTNLMMKVMQQTVAAVVAHPDPRGLVTREVFVQVVMRVLPVVSANLDSLVGTKPKPLVQITITAALDLAEDALQNRVNGTNLPLLIEKLLVQVLRSEIDPNDATALLSAARVLVNTL